MTPPDAPPHGGVTSNNVNLATDPSLENQGGGPDEVDHDEGATPTSSIHTGSSTTALPTINGTQNLVIDPTLLPPDNSEETSDVTATRSKRTRSKRKRE